MHPMKKRWLAAILAAALLLSMVGCAKTQTDPTANSNPSTGSTTLPGEITIPTVPEETDPSDATLPTDPQPSTEPSEPVEPTEPETPTEPVEPTEPEEPSGGNTSGGNTSGGNTSGGNTSSGNTYTQATLNHVTVHDPSIVKDPATGMYYIFGSHMAWAKSKDLMNWTIFTNNINRDYRTLFAAEAAWAAKASSSYDVSGNLWAPDVIWNEDMGKWCMYMSVNGPKWNSTICLLTADKLDGDWTYVGPVIQSGMSNGFGVTFDYTLVTGETTPASRYALRNNNPTWEPHAIDPCVTYDAEGNLWLCYGSWSGGIGMIRLDNKTGLRDYTTTYDYVSSVSDPYCGYKLSGGNQRSGEAPYIQRIGDYYYLFVTYGGLVANGGYNMRVFRSKNIYGPYTDRTGHDPRYPFNSGDPGSNRTGMINDVVGNRVMSYYKWSFMSQGYCAQGHNSAFVDSDGRAYIVYHTRFSNSGEGHQVRVHQVFVNEDGWLVTAPFEYAGEKLSASGYTAKEVEGVYEVLFHVGTDYENKECVTGENLQFNADGTITGDRSGTWKWSSKGSPYVTLTMGSVTYKGVFLEQKLEDRKDGALCFTVMGSDEIAVWGYKTQLTEVPGIPDNADSETLTGTEWWTANQVGKDYVLSGDGTLTLLVECQATNNGYGAFNVELVENGKYITTGSDQNAWYAGATGDAISGVASTFNSTIGVGLYTVTITRSGKTFTVTYYDAGGNVYAKYVAANTDLGTDVSIHVIAQVGTYKVAKK